MGCCGCWKIGKVGSMNSHSWVAADFVLDDVYNVELVFKSVVC